MVVTVLVGAAVLVVAAVLASVTVVPLYADEADDDESLSSDMILLICEPSGDIGRNIF